MQCAFADCGCVEKAVRDTAEVQLEARPYGCLLVALFVSLSAVVLWGLAVWSRFDAPVKPNEFGDAMGPVAGFFSAIAFAIAFVALLQQMRELALSREQFTRTAEAQAIGNRLQFIDAQCQLALQVRGQTRDPQAQARINLALAEMIRWCEERSVALELPKSLAEAMRHTVVPPTEAFSQEAIDVLHYMEARPGATFSFKWGGAGTLDYFQFGQFTSLPQPLKVRVAFAIHELFERGVIDAVPMRGLPNGYQANGTGLAVLKSTSRTEGPYFWEAVPTPDNPPQK